jgi:hypothetical protein
MRKKMDCQFSLNLLSFRKSSHTHLLAALLLSLTVTLSLAANREVYAGSGKSFFLTQLNQPLDREWTHHKLVMETRYVLVSEDGKSAIQAVGQQSSSGLYKEITYPIREYPWLEWKWKLEKAHKTADLKIKEKEDMALGVFFIFSRPWLPWKTGSIAYVLPWKTGSIAYVWTSANHSPGQIVMHPRHPYVILEAGEEKKGRWITERRNLYEDYKRVYGHYPEKNPKAIALFTDNDQTKEPVIGYYGPIKAMKKSR